MPERQLTKPEIEANIRKTLAEAAQAEAAQRRGDAMAVLERAKLKAEGEKLASEARIAQALERAQQLQLEKAVEEREIEKTSNYYHRVYDFNGEVGYASVKNCMAQLRVWDRLEPECDIEIVFSSPGGSIVDGMVLFDYIQTLRRKGHKVTTGALGMAASMAGILLQAGDERWIGAECYLLVHELQAGAIGKIGELEDEMRLLHMMSSRILDIFASRTKLTKKQLEARWKRTDWWLSSDQSLKFGFVDAIH